MRPTKNLPRGSATARPAQRPRAADEARAAPLHFQLFTQLRDAIFRGDYPEHTHLPGELALGEEFGVSRITVRRALDELASRGLVQRVQGRGTMVCPRPSFSPVVADVNGLLERNVVIAFETTSELAEFAYVPAPAEVAATLPVARGELVQMAVRNRHRDGVPFAHVTSWIPERIGRRFDAQALGETPVLTLLERHGVVIDRIEQTISADLATRAVGRALAIEPDAALLKVERVVYATDGSAVEKSRALYPAQRHQYRITLRRGTSPKPRA
jgi:GntR family transcriptional regulator